MLLLQSVNVIGVYRKEFQGTFHSTQNCRNFGWYIKMEQIISVLSYRNIRDQLWRWSILTGLVISDQNIPFPLTNCCAHYRSFVSWLQEQKPNARWPGSGLCNLNVPLIRHVKFPTFQTVEWKAPPDSTLRPTGWVIELHPLTLFSQQNQFIIQVNSLENWQNEKALIFQVLNYLFRKLYGDQ